MSTAARPPPAAPAKAALFPLLFLEVADWGLETATGVVLSQMEPYQPGVQLQVKSFTPSTQVPLLRHGITAQSSILTLQVGPENPARQAHLNAFTRSKQVAPLRQGALAHSLMLWSQCAPVNPGGQSQVYELIPLLHTLGSGHGLLWQLSIKVPHSRPV